MHWAEEDVKTVPSGSPPRYLSVLWGSKVNICNMDEKQHFSFSHLQKGGINLDDLCKLFQL